MSSPQTRRATHAGSWYTADPQRLDSQLAHWLLHAQKHQPRDYSHVHIKALIGPHAGLSYSGSTAAFAYQPIQESTTTTESVRRVFLLGPSHHHYTTICELSQLSAYDTPLGTLRLDTETIDRLMDSRSAFKAMKRSVDEAEHSLELHLPYIAKVFLKDVKLIPILVGNLSPTAEREFASLLLPYFDASDSLFIFSSDFCHWGSRFGFQYYKKEDGEIYQSIEKLDRRAMQIIEDKRVNDFTQYLKETDNTICGRHPIGVLLNLIEQSRFSQQLNLKFVHYAQSSQVVERGDSSVSYAAAVVTKEGSAETKDDM